VDLLLELTFLRGDLVGFLVVGLDGVDPEFAGGVNFELDFAQLEVSEGLDQTHQGQVAFVLVVGQLQRDVLLEQLFLEGLHVQDPGFDDVLLLVLLGEDFVLDFVLTLQDGHSGGLAFEGVQVDESVEFALEGLVVEIARFVDLYLLLDLRFLLLQSLLLEVLAGGLDEVRKVVLHVVLG